MKRAYAFTAILLACIVTFSTAQAHIRHHGHHRHRHPAIDMISPGLEHMAESARMAQDSADFQWRFPDLFNSPAYGAAPEGPTRRHYHDGRPSRWCGWYMRQVMGVADRTYNLAREWAHWGRPAGGPGIGVVVVWRHHVGRIVGQASDGEWLINSGNDGHAVRTRARSVSGAIAFRV